MACSNSPGSCQQSGCYKEHTVNNDGENCNGISNEYSNSNGEHEDSAIRLCIKCKVNELTVSSTQFCMDCFRSNLYGKFRLAVTSNAMISPSDNVLVAFSGGSSSRVALQFVHEMQQKAQKNFDASPDRSLAVFGVGVAYIDENAIHRVPCDDFDKAINEMQLIVSSLAPPPKQFFVDQTESIFSSDRAAGGAQLAELVGVVNDVTGKQDLIEHLRMRSLQKIAFENGYTKILLGTCTSRIACRVLEATVKGQGFSLAGDIQYVDARWRTPVVLPLRDCLSEELTMLCSFESLKTVETLQQPRSGINGLISSFVKLLKDENPSRESTIVRTAGKLTPFSFNRIPEVGDHNDQLASKRRQKKYNLKPNESLPPESFCVICNSPLKKFNNTNFNGSDDGKTSAETYAAACSSCQYQILPEDPSSLEHFISLLPRSIKDNNDSRKLLRAQIQDCLLSDSDDGN